MSEIGSLWAGRVYGTNTGNLFVELSESGPNVCGKVRFLDSALGIAVYVIRGTFDDQTLRVSGEVEQGVPGVEHGVLSIEARLTPDGNLRGTWSSTLGTGGTLEAFPHDMPGKPPQSRSGALVPEQLYSRNIVLGSVRLFAEDVVQLFEHLRQDFLTGRLVVTFHSNGNDVTKYAEDFLKNQSSLGPLEYLKVMIQEPDAHGINRLVVVELSAFGANEVRVQGVHETWVIGKAESTAALLKRKQSSLVTTYKKFGLNLNQAIFAAMLVAMPSIGGWIERALFTLAVFTLLAALLWLHANFIPNATVRLEIERPSFFVRAWPSILSWLGAATASLMAALVFYWLTKGPA